MSSAPPGRPASDRNAEATVHIAHLDEKVTDALLWELMIQAGPVHHVYIPRNRITGSHFGYGFCEFHTPLDALYATKVLNAVTLFSKPIRISQSTVDRVSQDVGANLFIGNLVDDVDEKTIHDAFSAFGPLIDAPYIMSSSNNNNNSDNSNTANASSESNRRRYGFVKYGQFEHADAAIAAMNGQYICNHPISVQYAFKKDSQGKERHGSEAERVLAARALQAVTNNPSVTDRLQPNTFFADGPASKTKLPPSPAIAVQQMPDHQGQPPHHPPPNPLPPPLHYHHPAHARPPHYAHSPSQPPHHHYPPAHGDWSMQHHASNAAAGVPGHGSHIPPYSGHQLPPHLHRQPQQPYGQYPPHRGMEVGWSQQHRRFNPRQQQPHHYRGPQHYPNPYKNNDNNNNRNNIPTPISDEKAPPRPPPSTNGT